MTKNFKNYLEQRRLRKIKPKLDQIVKLIQRAMKDIQTAEKNLVIDQDWSFTIAYHSMLRAGRALLLFCGFCPIGQAQHKTVVEVSGLILGKSFQELISMFDRMRRKRSDFIYESIELSLTEAKSAIKNAKIFIVKIEKIIKENNFQSKLF